MQSLIRKGLPCISTAWPQGVVAQSQQAKLQTQTGIIPKKPFLITKTGIHPKEALSNHQEEFGRQAGLCEAIEFLIPEDNQAGPGGLEETLKKVSQLQIGRR